MNSVDEIIQNLIAKQEENDLVPRKFEIDLDHLKSYIEKIACLKIGRLGSGAYKVVYPFKKDKVILEQFTSTKSNFAFRKQITNQLIEYGINTPKIIYYLTQNQAFKLGKKGISYEVQEKAKGSFLSSTYDENVLNHLYGLTKKHYKINPEFEASLCNKYNLEMLKSRVLTGIPHIEKFLKDFTCLSSVSALDVLERNFFYSPLTGYSFIDLDFDGFEENISDIDNFFNSRISELRKDSFLISYSELVYNCIGISKFYPTDPPNEFFEGYVYSGILLKQFFNVMQTSTDPKLRFAKEFADEFDLSEFYGASPRILGLIYSAIKTNNEEDFEWLRGQFNLPAEFNFNENLDGDSFIKAMDLTYAMEQPNNTTNLFANNVSEM